MLRRLRGVWDIYAKTDPLWAIVSSADKKGGRWDLAEFLQTGRHEVDNLLGLLAHHEIAVDRKLALDFGCGVGRVTQVLCRYFDTVHGVDISPRMIDTAKKLNTYGPRCEYHANFSTTLSQFADETFTFIYSNIVLQHIEPNVSLSYLSEFCRVLQPGGLLVFQMPSKQIPQVGLPDAAYRAEIEYLERKYELPAGEDVALRVLVKNISPVPWQCASGQPITLGNHWLMADHAMLRMDDGRVLVPDSLAPGGQAELSLIVRTPPAPGDYVLELDLVQEGVAWFKDKRSSTLQLAFRINERANANPIQQKPESSPPADFSRDEVFEGFAMHCVPRPTILALLYEHGCRLEFMQETDKAGPCYLSYFYFARKCA